MNVVLTLSASWDFKLVLAIAFDEFYIIFQVSVDLIRAFGRMMRFLKCDGNLMIMALMRT